MAKLREQTAGLRLEKKKKPCVQAQKCRQRPAKKHTRVQRRETPRREPANQVPAGPRTAHTACRTVDAALHCIGV